MRIIDHRQFGKKKTPAKRLHSMRPWLRGAALFLIIFLVCNIFVWVAYRGKALPNTVLGTKQVGGMTYDAIAQLKQADVLPEKLIFSKDKTTKELPSAQLGISADMQSSVMRLKKERSWLPLIDLVAKHHAPLTLKINEPTYMKGVDSIRAAFTLAPTDKHVTFDGKSFVVEDGKDGYEIQNDTLRKHVEAAVIKNAKQVSVPTQIVKTTIHDIDLTSEVDRLKKETQTQLSYNYKGQATKPSVSDIASWYVPDGQSMTYSSDKFGEYMNGLAAKYGIEIANTSDLGIATRYALAKDLNSNFVVVSSGASRHYTYCVASRGANETLLQDMVGKLAATYSDTRGWNAGGRISFNYATSGCDYTVWLAAPSQMAGFGSICDSYYNCQVGANVVVNSDRWLQATDAWNQTGRSLEDYRTLIINHESGHRLGYYDTNVCSEPGAAAPVMMQQSIDLMGCAFNEWPLQKEIDGLF